MPVLSTIGCLIFTYTKQTLSEGSRVSPHGLLPPCYSSHDRLNKLATNPPGSVIAPSPCTAGQQCSLAHRATRHYTTKLFHLVCRLAEKVYLWLSALNKSYETSLYFLKPLNVFHFRSVHFRHTLCVLSKSITDLTIGLSKELLSITETLAVKSHCFSCINRVNSRSRASLP